MKALSITQPYAEFFKNGTKMIETRSWKTNYRGKILIHASATRIPKAYKKIGVVDLVNKASLDYGKVICSCDLVDCVEMTEEYVEDMRKNYPDEFARGFYAVGRYAWVMENVEVLNDAIEAKGHLGLWNYERGNE